MFNLKMLLLQGICLQFSSRVVSLLLLDTIRPNTRFDRSCHLLRRSGGTFSMLHSTPAGFLVLILWFSVQIQAFICEVTDSDSVICGQETRPGFVYLSSFKYTAQNKHCPSAFPNTVNYLTTFLFKQNISEQLFRMYVKVIV